MTSSTNRLNLLEQNLPLLQRILRGIEKEGLRVDPQGKLALTPHPAGLGSALTNPRVTTDYSEALLELITGTHNSTETLLGELEDTHRFVASQLGDEVIWNQSMPAWLPGEADIPIAWYGNSNSGMLKHVYRRGLAERYGKAMQCIAGVHYNFSLPEAIWPLLGFHDPEPKNVLSQGYMALIRNFTRYSWLLMYLFGASPAISANFMKGRSHNLQQLDHDTLYLPYATSLRMSDLGYQNKAQSDLQLCYNDLETFLGRMYKAVTTPWPAYETIGTHRNGQWIQLNTNILQIENEYYSNIRPKRSTGRCERPITALAQRGIQYVEVRCLDIDPESPVGITAETSRFMDTFLLFCAVEHSADFPDNGFCTNSQSNFASVVKEGRKPGLLLGNQGQSIGLVEWGTELLERMLPYAHSLDQAYGGTHYANALTQQFTKLRDCSLTPSARLLSRLQETGLSLHDYSLQRSREHRDTLLGEAPTTEMETFYAGLAKKSVSDQKALEDSDTESFDDYVARYHAALMTP